ncbi:MAG: hypothetical protein BM555_02310 [Crocinitomix sp. MedPE-SWsnd]|nr:MAG: hypothetical protein BM555_02310 [Crocinitomix sp. MedPE-SWsnd]
MSNIQNSYDMIEACIRKLGIDPTTTRGQNAGQWSLMKGSAKVYIDCWMIESEGRAYFQVMSPVMQVPADKKESFYFDLLSFNDRLYSCAFALFKDWAWIKMIRECEGLDEDAAFAIITRVGHYADQYDDMLKQHYEASASVETADANGAGR